MSMMSRREIAMCLHDYATLQYRVINYSDITIETIFKDYMEQTGRPELANEEYFKKIVGIYRVQLALKDYSITEDFLLNRDNYLSENKLDDFIKKCSIEPSNANLSKKRIIQLIRNAFNHNDNDDFDKFRLSDDLEYIEIRFKDIRTPKEKANGGLEQPLKITVDLKYLDKLHQEISEKAENVNYMRFNIPRDFKFKSKGLHDEIDRIKIPFYNFRKKLSEEQINKFNEMPAYTPLGIEKSEYEEYAKSLSDSRMYEMTDLQKETLYQNIRSFTKYNMNMIHKYGKRNIITYFLTRLLPIPALKQEMLENQKLYNDVFFSRYNLSYNDIISRIGNVVLNPDCNPYSSEYDTQIHKAMVDKIPTLRALYMYLDLNMQGSSIAMPIIIYVDYVISTLCTDEYITIGGETYKREELRNSLVHSRWHTTIGDKIAFYDADPKNEKAIDLDFIGEISINDLYTWATEYTVNYYNDRSKAR